MGRERWMIYLQQKKRRIRQNTQENDGKTNQSYVEHKTPNAAFELNQIPTIFFAQDRITPKLRSTIPYNNFYRLISEKINT